MYRYRQLRLDQKYRQDPNDCNKNRKKQTKTRLLTSINTEELINKQKKKINQSNKLNE